MADATVTIDGLKPFEILLDVPTKISLDQETVPLDYPDDTINLLIGQVFGTQIGRYFRFFDNLAGSGGTDSVNVTQAELSLFFTGNINS